MAFMEIKSKLTMNPKLGDDIRASITMMLDRISAFAQKVAVTNAPANTGLLRNSIHTIPAHIRGNEFIAGIQTNLPYAVVMEQGRRPGWPPYAPLKRWVQLKTRKGDMKLPKGMSKKRGVESLTFLVRRGIKRHGIKPRWFFKKAEHAVNLKFGREIAALGAAIKRAWEAGG